MDGNKRNDKGNREERLRFEIEKFVPPTIFPSFSAVGVEDCRVLNFGYFSFKRKVKRNHKKNLLSLDTGYRIRIANHEEYY